MSKKTWILISCLVLSLTLGLGGSLAYLTDTDTKINTFTMGNVDIEVEEEFENNAQLKPGIEIDKKAKIANTGNNDAYVWMTVAVPAEVDEYINLSWNPDEGEGDTGKNVLLGVTPDGDPVTDDGEFVWYYEAQDEEGKNYHVYTQIWWDPLAVGDETEELLLGVTLNEYVDVIDGEYYYIENGEKTKIDYDLNGMQIIVTGYAIQTDGFEQGGVIAAYNAYRGQWGEQQVPNIDSDDKNTWMVHDTNSLQDALNNAGDGTVITLATGEYDMVYMGDSNDVTIRAAVGADARVKGLVIDDDAGLKVNNLRIENITFVDEGIKFNFADGTPWSLVDGLTVQDCCFYGSNDENGGRLIDIGTDSPGSHQLKNVTIWGCNVENAMQGIRLGGVSNAEIAYCNISNVYHNAITLRSISGDCEIHDCNINNGGDRAFRIGALNNGTVTYRNNNIVNTGDPDGSNFKANSIADGAAVVFEGNTVDGADWNPLQ